ncbi:MAG: biopolymer transporter ExbD [Bdellovibrionota bacterium]|nr:biopolymer transporter ExbD [Bdellovibrionota bacterium]
MKLRSRRRSKEALDLDITSLLDILVILLVFLLNSYSASEFKFEPVSNIELAPSSSQKMGLLVPTIQVNKDKDVYLENKKVGTLKRGIASVSKLESKLAEIKKQNEESLSQITDKAMLADRKKKLEMVNIVMDKSLSYGDLDRIMTMAGNSGHTKFKFIVQTAY